MPDDTLSQTLFRGMSLRMQSIKKEEIVSNDKYVLLKAQLPSLT